MTKIFNEDETLEKQTTTSHVKTPEEAATVGMFLRHSRLAQKMTIDQAAKALCIRRTYIKAIEESNFAELPPVPYGTGFVRSYAQLLGLNVERIVQCYKEESAPKKSAEKTMHQPSASSRAAVAKPKRRHIIMGLTAVVLICAVWLFLTTEPQKPELQETPEVEVAEPLPEFVPEQVLEEEEVTIEPAEETEVVEQKPEARVHLKLTGESWLEVRDKEKVYLTGTYQQGFEYDVPEGEGMRLSVGKRLNVEVYIDGELTPVVRAGRQINVPLDEYLNH